MTLRGSKRLDFSQTRGRSATGRIKSTKITSELILEPQTRHSILSVKASYVDLSFYSSSFSSQSLLEDTKILHRSAIYGCRTADSLPPPSEVIYLPHGLLTIPFEMEPAGGVRQRDKDQLRKALCTHRKANT